MQTTYGYPDQRTYPGNIISEDYFATSKPALEKITAGSVVGYVGNELLAFQNPSSNKFVLSADLIASNKVNLTLKIKTIDSSNKESSVSVAMAEITYGISHAATMTAICAAIAAADTTGKTSATVDAADGTGRTIYVTHSENAVIILSGVTVTAGVSQATVSYDFYGKLYGIAAYKGNSEQDLSTGKTYINPTEPVGAIKQGVITIYSIDAMNMDSTMYAQFIEDTGASIERGQIRTSTASSKAIAFSGLKPNAKVAALAVSEVELNLP